MSNHPSRSRRLRGTPGHRPTAEQVIAARGRLGMTQKQFAERFSLGIRTLQEIEAGHRGETPVSMDAARWELVCRVMADEA